MTVKQAEFVWIVAHTQPATVDEVSAAFPRDHIRQGISKVATLSFRNGLVQRRRRETEGKGMNPYEYALAPLPDTTD